MNATHVHLLINHLPVIGTFFGMLVLLYGILAKSVHTRNAAYFILVIAAIGGFIAYQTGEAAEHVAEKLPGVTKELIHEHEEAAEKAIFGIVAVGIASLAGLFINRRRGQSTGFAWIVFLVAFITCGITAYTAYLGGSVRHTEIRQGAQQLEQEAED
jgi:uncharacterized membrane protein